MSGNEIAELVEQKIASLRPKLLDLTRRNPLLATKLGPKSNSHVRVVDELPDVLFYRLNNDQTMRLVPLPAIDDDPRDEQTPAFREAVINARLTDEQFISELASADGDAEDYIDVTLRLERSLKDRVRTAAGMPPRSTKSDIDLNQHAKLNGITPSYELPMPDAERSDGRLNDADIQTLLLPTDLERKLNAITSKCRTWAQETGMNVLHVAYGFLEWSDGAHAETSFAPLILREATIEKHRSRQGVEFSIAGTGEDAAANAVLAHKLRADFAVELPAFGGASVETYFSDVAALSPRNMTWRVRRQVAIGVFPSARMAMYHDLNPDQPDFPKSEIVESLLCGSNADRSSPFADEYAVDHPDIESKVPYLVMDADSSQFSTLVDIAEGRNLAVEGPPGTGKSQTIVNAIAAALSAGKKVLFVAEKLAALNVVKSRLEAAGLGEFLLPLQAERSTREQVIASVRERMEMESEPPVRNYQTKLEEYRAVRQRIADYIDLMGRPFGDSGLNIREIFGRSIATTPSLAGLPLELIETCEVPQNLLTGAGLDRLRQLGARIAKAHQESASAPPYWRGTRLVHAGRFTIEEACDLAGRAARAFSAVADARDRLADVGLPPQAATASLSRINDQLAEAERFGLTHGVNLPISLLRSDNAEAAQRFIERCDAWQQQGAKLARVVAPKPDASYIDLIRKTAAVCERLKLGTVSPATLGEDLKSKRDFIAMAQAVSVELTPLVGSRPDSSGWPLIDIAKAHRLIGEAGRDALLARNARTRDPDATLVLEDLCRRGRQLQAQKQELAAKVSFAAEVSSAALSDAIGILRGAGLFSFLSPAYHGAKRQFLSISLASKYDRREALDTLEALIGFRKRETEFNAQAQAGAVFGFHFRGIDTDFERFERLAKFYTGIDAHFSSPAKKALRAFLRESEIQELEMLPAIPPVVAQVTFDGLRERIAVAESEAATLEDAMAALAPFVHVFADPKAVRPDDLVPLGETIRAFLDEEAALDGSDDAKLILGACFKGAQTSGAGLGDVVSWGVAAQATRTALSRILAEDNTALARDLLAAVFRSETGAQEILQRVSTAAAIDGARLQDGCATSRETAARLESAAADADGLARHAVFAATLEDARPHGVLPLAEARLSGALDLEPLADQFEAVAVRQLARAVHAVAGPELSGYPGTTLDELRANLAELDREIIQLSRKQLRKKVLAAAKPPGGNGIGRKSTWTEGALIENEISKKQRFISVRDLTQRAGRALLELKPCWMMSPLAVAQYVPKGSIHFDLCIIDEASQMPPESAIGALLRCDQTVVVGDTNQLPPSSFFKTVIDDDDADEDENVISESILEMANATFRPARRLRWHYRSRHSGLIKFANRLVYDDNLIVFPSATESMSRMGVELRHLAAQYKSGTNPIEADAVIEAAFAFMRTDPERSLGIVTLNQKQRDLISEKFETAVGRHQHALDYIEFWKKQKDGLEEFFIKNLENVQGDERDVIYIGTVYGPEKPGGPVAQRFGPINGIAGKRRLNVLFTRAKQKIVTFSSMTSADIAAEENRNAGVYMLKRWLEYSASGLLEGGEQTERPPDSDFETFVMSQIQGMGCEAVPQVGVVGYFVDIGVRHPEWPYGFLLGVECDGASYHSAKSARDRDRLRQEVLEGLGWRLHRIWSTDWFNNPRREAEKLRALIATRLTELKARESDYAKPAAVPDTRKAEAAPAPAREVAGLPLFESQRDPVKPAEVARKAETVGKGVAVADGVRRIAVGDTVRVKYLTDERKILQVTISRSKSDPSQGIINSATPIAKALLGAEEGDEVEVLVGSYVKPAVVERIFKGGIPDTQTDAVPTGS